MVQQGYKSFIEVDAPVAAPSSEAGIERHNWRWYLSYYAGTIAYAYTVDDRSAS